LGTALCGNSVTISNYAYTTYGGLVPKTKPPNIREDIADKALTGFKRKQGLPDEDNAKW
jgi:hypothetical protein